MALPVDAMFRPSASRTGASTGSGPLSPPPGAGDGGEAAEYSTTNTQEADVDEADFIKNDGGHVYLLAHGKFQIFDAWPAAETHRLASVAIEGEPKKLFVHDKRALVYSSLTPASGGYFPSTVHRVVNPETAQGGARFSMPMFLHPRPEVVLKPGVTADDFLQQRLREIGLKT